MRGKKILVAGAASLAVAALAGLAGPAEPAVAPASRALRRRFPDPSFTFRSANTCPTRSCRSTFSIVIPGATSTVPSASSGFNINYVFGVGSTYHITGGTFVGTASASGNIVNNGNIVTPDNPVFSDGNTTVRTVISAHVFPWFADHTRRLAAGYCRCRWPGRSPSRARRSPPAPTSPSAPVLTSVSPATRRPARSSKTR